MFYYLGRKKRLAGLYPEPLYDTIIEPFAGSAAYSLHGDRWQKNVIINEFASHTILVWEYLLQASRSDIERLPDLVAGDKLSDLHGFSDAELWLMRWHISPGSRPRAGNDVVSRFSRWGAGKRYIAENIHKIKHWKLMRGDYSLVPNQKATWFIDPPYESTQDDYYQSDVDFNHLSRWCLDRDGQVIVCEQAGAKWLPFVDLATIDIAGKAVSKEVVFIK